MDRYARSWMIFVQTNICTSERTPYAQSLMLQAAGRDYAELLRTPSMRSSQSAGKTNFRHCGAALLGHHPRLARQRTGAWATGCFETHVSALSAGKKNARRSKENCIQGSVTQRIMIGAGKERGRDRTRVLTALSKPPRGSTRNAPSRLHGHEGSEPRHDRKQSV